MDGQTAATPLAEPAPAVAIAPPADVTPRKSRWAQAMPVIASATSDFRTLIFNLFVLLLVGLLAPVVASQFWRNEVVIEPIAVPEQLQSTGLTPEVASARLVDALREVDEAGGTAIEAIDVVAATDRVDFAIPDSGLSIDSLVYYVRRFFNIQETRIGGEFRCGDPDCTVSGVSLRLRVSAGESHVVQVRAMQTSSEDSYFYEAALRLMEEFQPIVALAAIVEDQPVKAEVMAHRIIRSNPEQAHWAHNMLGIIRANAGEMDVAAAEFSAALALDANFIPAKTNLAGTRLADGDVEGARTLYDEVRRAEPDNVRAIEGLADIAVLGDQRDEALELYRRATTLDPASTRYLVKAALMQIKAGDAAAGEALMQEALQVDPTDPGALAQLGLIYYQAGDYAAAVPYFRNAADFAPADAALQFQVGRAMLLSDDPQSAAQRLDLAARLAPSDVRYKTELADALGRIGNHEQARVVLADALALAPDDADVLFKRGLNFQALGRNDEAAAAFRRVIALVPDDANATMATRYLELLEEAATAETPAAAAQ
jgi:tetratricopeptide (TPR) repeat protein